MRARNWAVSLAVPLLAAIAVGIAAVIIVGANNNVGTAPAAIDAGFPPARSAVADFSGAGAGAAVQVSAIAAAGATQVAAGSAANRPALWVSQDGGSSWRRAAVTPLANANANANHQSGQIAWIAHGTAGWLAVGDTATAATAAGTAAASQPLVLGSPNGSTWTVTGDAATFAGPGLVVTAAAAAGGAGYVIVGHTSVGARMAAAAWYAPGRTGWRRASDARPGALDGPGNRVMNAVTATSRGFAAVGAVGARPAAWLSGTGRTWTLVPLPLPVGAASAALDYVAADGGAVAAVGTEVTASGQRLPFDAVSTDAGATWTLAPLPLPATAPATVAVTALTAAGGGFTATGSYGLPGESDVVVWTLPAGAAGGIAAGWTAVTPQGKGLSGPGVQAITALTAAAATMTGVGFTATTVATEPTIWQSPVRS